MANRKPKKRCTLQKCSRRNIKHEQPGVDVQLSERYKNAEELKAEMLKHRKERRYSKQHIIKMAATTDNISQDLIWEITRNNNAFLVKRTGYGGVKLSRDPYNLTNKHNRKHAGYASDQAISVNADSPNTVGLSTKVAKNSHRPANANKTTSFSSSTGSRKVYRSVVNSTTKKGYRPDLRGEAVSRASAIKLSQREKKDTPAPKLRGAKARKAAEKTEA
ncbi:hypothetical protein MRB53_038829 [Persea americana]|nr:hypothetical protein MRB53_038829 [Persea americana]